MKIPVNQIVKIILAGLACLSWTGSSLLAAEAMQVNIFFVAGDGDYAMHRAGAELGVAEGNIQGRFLGIHYTLTDLVPGQVSQVDNANLPAAVVVAGNEDLLRQVQAAYAPLDVAVFNIALADDALRRECIPGVFHTPPSRRMLRDAEAQWLQANPGAEVTAMAWHADFVKFAGRDLNRRFREQAGTAMDSDAWGGWVATRGLAEAVVRTNTNDPAALSRYLRDAFVIDGQKGVPHSFRQTGQLRQPLLLTQNGELLGEAPVRGVAADTELDTLGITACE